MIIHTITRRLALLTLVFSSLSAQAQIIKCGSVDSEAEMRMQRDMDYLASDELGGRLPGTPGAELAMGHVIEAFQDAGLKPYFKGKYTQSFAVPRPASVPAELNGLWRGRRQLKVDEGFLPSPYAHNATVEGKTRYVGHGLVHEASGLDAYQGKNLDGRIAVMQLNVSGQLKATVGKAASMRSRINVAREHGAIGVLFIDPSLPRNKILPTYRPKRTHDLGLPSAIIGTRKASRKMRRNYRSIRLQTTIISQNAEAYNVGGYLDLGAEQTIILGAHYDHVGLGYWGSGKPEAAGEVHNGADDNASGTTLLMEMARQLSLRGDLQKRNVLFLAFSGEEDGLVGSKYFVNEGSFDPSAFSYMINMDMVGRLKQGDSLTIYATSSAAEWPEIIRDMPCDQYQINEVRDLFPRSDHASFARAGLPAIMLFTGFHDDYHRPEDDIEFIDIPGMARVAEAALEIIRRVQSVDRLTYIPPGK